MKQSTESQQAFLALTAEAVNRARGYAKQAEKLGLMTLAREWDYFSTSFQKAIERQLRVFEVQDLTEETFFFKDRQGGFIEAYTCIVQNGEWIRSTHSGRWKSIGEFMESFTQAGALRFNARAGVWLCGRCGHGEHGPICSAAPWCDLCNGPQQQTNVLPFAPTCETL